MFDIELDGIRYYVNFQHNTKDEFMNGRSTTCRIFIRDENGEPEYVFTGHAQCAKTDNFDRSVGRKVALGHALIYFNRDVRKVFWEKYFSITPKKQLAYPDSSVGRTTAF